ncbi:hypothetical protein [Anthocerotibacter panamensis]|uniref:hypothetical protein n=1 Tax=Anthocerotibacter panamensis TaxID=2857077 RepID=UPI001C4051B6|nr:hypothetical protein [Anthocerotibacter panamensis]
MTRMHHDQFAKQLLDPFGTTVTALEVPSENRQIDLGHAVVADFGARTRAAAGDWRGLGLSQG